MKFRLLLALLILRLSSPDCFGDEKARFVDVEIEKPFSHYLLGRPLLMEIPGAKIIRKKSGDTIVLAVASTVLKDSSPAERLRAERVCRVKALASVVSEAEGVQVCHVESLNETTEIVIDEKGESAKSVSELLQVTKTTVQGMTKDMPVVGRWRSNDGKVFYLAIGAGFDRNGSVVELGDDE